MARQLVSAAAASSCGDVGASILAQSKSGVNVLALVSWRASAIEGDRA